MSSALPHPLGTFPAPVPPATGRSIRLVTYNILADQYASQDFSKEVLFKHVPLPWLEVHYRKQLVLKQLLHCAADVLCLQEVDAKVFDLYLEPLLEAAGFSGVYDSKAGQVTEGSAIFYRNSLFECLGRCARRITHTHVLAGKAFHAAFEIEHSNAQGVTAVAQPCVCCAWVLAPAGDALQPAVEAARLLQSTACRC